jgi:hypothetical protein
MKTTMVVWLTRPEAAIGLDTTDAEQLFKRGHITYPDLDMTDHGWIQIGLVDMEYHIEKNAAKISHEAVLIAHAGIDRLRAECEVRVNECLNLIGKLQSLEWNGEAL